MTGERMTDRRPPGWSRGTIRGDRLAMTAVVALVLALTVPPMGAGADGGHELTGVVYDIEAVADGSILIAENTRVMELRRGEFTLVADLPTAVGEGPIGTPATGAVNGLAATARGDVFATTGGIDAAQGAALWRVSRGTARQVADIAAFEVEHDPDAAAGSRWKHPRCEEAAGYSPGPQSNPYHLTALSGSGTLIADAAGNTLLVARTNGDVDWVAVFPPAYDDAGDWMVEQVYEGIECYVQPVPTAVAIGPDGAYYVGELSGFPTDPTDLVGLARIWRIDAGARNVACPSEACKIVIDGLTSVVDVEFGPDGRLYVVELDASGWLAAFGPTATGGTIKACDVGTGTCELIEDGLATPGAITFDRRGQLWVAESIFFQPKIRPVDLSVAALPTGPGRVAGSR
jgi:hypothetical protein